MSSRGKYNRKRAEDELHQNAMVIENRKILADEVSGN